MITITAATGQLGQAIVSQLLKETKAADVKLVVRDPAKAEAFRQEGVRVQKADYDDKASLVAAFQGTDTLLLISGNGSTPDRIRQHRDAIDAAKQARVKRVVYTSFIDADPASPSTIAEVHSDTEAYLKASGLVWTILRNGVYAEQVAGEAEQAVQSGVVASPTGDAGISYITREDLARATVAALLSKEPANKIYTLTGTTAVSQKQFAQILSRVTGTPIKFVPITFEQLETTLTQNGMPDFVVDLIVGFQKSNAQGRAGLVTNDVEALTGTAPRSFESVVERLLTSAPQDGGTSKTNVSVLGAGTMARAIATRLIAGGNNVTFFARNPEKAQALADELKPLAKKGATLKTAPLGSPITDAVVINTLWYNIARDVVTEHAKQLSGKILVDITNPLNQTYDDLTVPPGTSAAEELQKLAPTAHVVKGFNTVFAGLLGQGTVAGLPLDVLIAGDDENAKATVTKLVESGGLRVIDAGPLKRARQLESLGLLNITLQSKMENPWMTGVKLLA